jgi:hypothetical protein
MDLRFESERGRVFVVRSGGREMLALQIEQGVRHVETALAEQDRRTLSMLMKGRRA